MNTKRPGLFQDLAGTVPAVADGDPVAVAVCDLSGTKWVSGGSTPPVLRGGLIAFPPEQFPPPRRHTDPEADTPVVVTG